MANQIIEISLRKLKEFITMLPLQLQVPSKEYLRITCIYSKLGFESLKFRHWFRKLHTFIKIKTTGKPEHLFDIIPKIIHLLDNYLPDITTFYSKIDIFKYSFFPSIISEWNKLDRRIQQSTIMLSFRKCLIKDWSTYS